MFLGLIDTREHRPDGDEHEPPRFELPQELRPWPWYLATIGMFALALQLDGWPGLIPTVVAFGCFLNAVTSYYRGNDGLRKYRQ
jgi:hypothetical protein